MEILERASLRRGSFLFGVTRLLKVRRKNKRFNIFSGKAALSDQVGDLPNCEECIKILSFGGFSSASLIAFVAEKTRIRRLLVSTFRVGKKEIQMLNALHSAGRLEKAEFVVFSLMQESDDHGYFQLLQAVCSKNGWSVKTLKNHSKVILLDTDDGFFVCETSSNLNENPKIEQFSIEQDEALFEFYRQNLFI